MSTHRSLNDYIPLVEFLGKVCGCNYEFVLHDASNPEQSIIAIANEHISGRKVGGPMTDLALKLIREEYYKTQDYIVNEGRTKDNKILMSSTYFIRDHDQSLLGLLCINNNMTELITFNKYLTGLMQSFNIFEKSEGNKKTPENIDISVEDLIKNALDNVFFDISVSPERMSSDEKIQIVQNLNDQGVFLLKGAVSEIAKRLKTSEPTIYRYINKKN